MESEKEVARFEKARAAGLKTVLFVCTGNAVRSQFAEGLVNHFLKGKWAAFSGGIIPVKIPKDVVKVMHEIGIDMDAAASKHVDLFKDCRFDKVVVLCSDVDRMCPNLPECAEQEHMIFQDPMSSSLLSEGACFGMKPGLRLLRDEMRKALLDYLGE
ncbi:MAG TPA: arsenate reductase ArsC [Dissulfurispiraceae bacterium]